MSFSPEHVIFKQRVTVSMGGEIAVYKFRTPAEVAERGAQSGAGRRRPTRP